MAHQQESFLPFSSWQSLSCSLSRVAKRSTPKPHGPLYSPSEPCGPFSHFRTSWFSLFLLQNHMALFLFPQNLVVPSLLQSRVVSYLLQSCMVSSPFTLESHGLLLLPKTLWSSPLLWSRVVSPFFMAAGPRLKSQCPSSFAAPFLTPPTVSYTCQHPCILPALLGCHSKSGQVWPHGMEPIISKLSHRPCNQGELLPSPILGGSHSHPPGSKQGHSYLTYL